MSNHVESYCLTCNERLMKRASTRLSGNWSLRNDLGFPNHHYVHWVTSIKSKPYISRRMQARQNHGFSVKRETLDIPDILFILLWTCAQFGCVTNPSNSCDRSGMNLRGASMSHLYNSFNTLIIITVPSYKVPVLLYAFHDLGSQIFWCNPKSQLTWSPSYLHTFPIIFCPVCGCHSPLGGCLA